jgi:hypothetical protein
MCNINEHLYFLERSRETVVERITHIEACFNPCITNPAYLDGLRLELARLDGEIAQAKEQRRRREFATVLKEAGVGAALFVAFAFFLCGLGWLWNQ